MHCNTAVTNYDSLLNHRCDLCHQHKSSLVVPRQYGSQSIMYSFWQCLFHLSGGPLVLYGELPGVGGGGSVVSRLVWGAGLGLQPGSGRACSWAVGYCNAACPHCCNGGALVQISTVCIMGSGLLHCNAACPCALLHTSLADALRWWALVHNLQW